MYFDIISSLPSPHKVPMVSEIKKILREVQKKGDSIYSVKHTLTSFFTFPFSHPLRILMGSSYDNMDEFLIQFYTYPCITISSLKTKIKEKFNVSYSIMRKKNEITFFNTCPLEKYKILQKKFSHGFSSKDYSYLMYLFLRSGFFSGYSYKLCMVDTLTNIPYLSPSHVQDTIFPELKNSSNDIHVEYETFFKEDAFSSFSVEPSGEREMLLLRGI